LPEAVRPEPALPDISLPGPEAIRSEPALPEIALSATVRPEPKAALPETALPQAALPGVVPPEPDAMALPEVALRAPEPTEESPTVLAEPRFVAFPGPSAAPAAEPPSPKTAPPLVHAARAVPKPAAPSRSDVLAAIAALSDEEKIALFS
jgi:hypothetical protein